MSRTSTSLGVAAVALVCLALSAEDFQPLLSTAQVTWPDKHHIGVICNYQANEAEIRTLAKAAGEGALITVVDARVPDQANSAATILANNKTDFVVLMPKDRFFCDGSYGATLAVKRLASRGVPSIGTTPTALEQGAVFSLGEGTKGEILVTNRLIGTVDVVLPNRTMAARKTSMFLRGEGMATIALHRVE
jgi:hypothetical protein